MQWRGKNEKVYILNVYNSRSLSKGQETRWYLEGNTDLRFYLQDLLEDRRLLSRFKLKKRKGVRREKEVEGNEKMGVRDVALGKKKKQEHIGIVLRNRFDIRPHRDQGK